MAYNVISCQKVAENTQILKIAKFGVGKTWEATILTLEQNPPERKFLTYIKMKSHFMP